MEFEDKFNKIKDIIQEDLSYLEESFEKDFTSNTLLDKDLLAFLTAPAKRLRPILSALFLRCVFNELNSKQKEILLAVELIHNATLIHDDVIDKAQKRRTKETFNMKFNDNLAVIAGDFLLSVAMEKIINTDSVEVIKICTLALKSTCSGEIDQYFKKFQITTIEDYIEKSRKKTALLFEIGPLGGLFVGEKQVDENLKQTAKDFSQNFGIAFQIRDDLINILNAEKILVNDINSGIYTAPVIFAYQENNNILNETDILKAIRNTRGIEKTQELMDNYFDKAIEAIQNLEENIYKKAMFELIELLKTSL
jgi:geranylgeranyl pyrophosphate synthase